MKCMFTADIVSSGVVSDGSIHRQYIKLRRTAENLSEDSLSVLLDTIRLVHTSPLDSIPRHMTMVLTEAWLAYSRISPER